MGTVYRKIVTRPVPKNAEPFVKNGEPFVRWRDKKGKPRTAKVTKGKDGSERIAETSPYFIAKYRDGNGIVVEVSTGCRHEDAARRVLADLERQAELIRSGVVTSAEAAVGRHKAASIETHFDAFDTHLRAKDATKVYRENTARFLRRLAAECRFDSLVDFRREPFENWLVERTTEGMAAKTRNAYRCALVTFCNWCVAVGRLSVNPFRAVPQANAAADPRRQRRALTEDELIHLLAVARERPLREALTVRKGKRAGERVANVKPEVRDRLDLLGRERALIYKTLVLTGLRKNELASLIVSSLHLDAAVPFAALAAADEKNRQGSEIALRDDLAADLRAYGSPTVYNATRAKLSHPARPFRRDCRPIRRCSSFPLDWFASSTETCDLPASRNETIEGAPSTYTPYEPRSVRS